MNIRARPIPRRHDCVLLGMKGNAGIKHRTVDAFKYTCIPLSQGTRRIRLPYGETRYLGIMSAAVVTMTRSTHQFSIRAAAGAAASRQQNLGLKYVCTMYTPGSMIPTQRVIVVIVRLHTVASSSSSSFPCWSPRAHPGLRSFLFLLDGVPLFASLSRLFALLGVGEK